MTPEQNIAEAEAILAMPLGGATNEQYAGRMARAQVYAILAFAQFEGIACQLIREDRESGEADRAKHLAAHDAHTAAHKSPVVGEPLEQP